MPWSATGAPAAAASLPNSSAASGAAARSGGGVGGGSGGLPKAPGNVSSWLQAVGRGGPTQGGNSKTVDAAGGAGEGVGAGAWKAGKPSLSSAGAGGGAGSGLGGGAWAKGAPNLLSAPVLSTPKPSREGPGGSGGADVRGGKGARGGDAGVWDGEKQSQIDKMRLQCEQELANIYTTAAAKDVGGRNSNSKARNGGTWGTHSEKYFLNCLTSDIPSKCPLCTLNSLSKVLLRRKCPRALTFEKYLPRRQRRG